MLTTKEKPRLHYVPTEIESLEAALSSASFVIYLPKGLPEGFGVSRIRHHFPNWVPRDRVNPRCDFVEVRYGDGSGREIEVLHGFFSRYIGVHALVPNDVKGTFDVGGATAYWMSVKAQGTAVVNGRYVPAQWVPGFAAVAWETGQDEDSHLYFSMSSHSLSVKELQVIAQSVGPA